MKKKFVLSIAIAALALLLCSCADVSVSYQLSNDNKVAVDYKLVLSSSGEDVGSYIDAITNYWQQMGFSAGYSSDNDTYTITGNKIIEKESRAGAAAALSSVLTDENSLFYDADFVYTPSYFEDNYSFTAKISLEDIIRKSEDRTIPTAEVRALLASAASGEYKLSISLPGEVTDTNADEQTAQACTWLLKYGETREINIASKQMFEENAAHYADLSATQSRDNLLFVICGIAAAVLVLMIIIAAVVRRTRRSKISIKRF